MLLAPISARAETDAQLEAAKAETLKQAAEGGDTDTAPAWWPWKGGEPEKPPEPKTYKMPTMADDGLDYHDKPAPIVQAPALDSDAIFKSVLGCFPEKSKYDIDVNLRASLRSNDVLDLEDAATSLGKNYVGIVATMPLYSGKELDREKEREYVRRKDTATAVAAFVTAIASRNHAIRELALYRSLEARSAIRVQQGLSKRRSKSGIWKRLPARKKSSLPTRRRSWKAVCCCRGCVTRRTRKVSVGG